MSELLSFAVLIRYATRAGPKRLAFYLAEETRPSFPDDVPVQEAAWVNAFEFLPTAELEQPDDYTLVAHFSNDSGFGDELDEVLDAVALTGPETIYFHAFLGDNEWYARYRKGRQELVWAVAGLDDPDDDERLNRNLSDADKERIITAGGPARSLSVLAQIDVQERNV